MLMKYAKVSRDGTYSPPPASNAKASYSTMVYVRSTIVEDAGWHLARAATISVSGSTILLRKILTLSQSSKIPSNIHPIVKSMTLANSELFLFIHAIAGMSKQIQ